MMMSSPSSSSSSSSSSQQQASGDEQTEESSSESPSSSESGSNSEDDDYFQAKVNPVGPGEGHGSKAPPVNDGHVSLGTDGKALLRKDGKVPILKDGQLQLVDPKTVVVQVPAHVIANINLRLNACATGIANILQVVSSKQAECDGIRVDPEDFPIATMEALDAMEEKLKDEKYRRAMVCNLHFSFLLLFYSNQELFLIFIGWLSFL